MARKKPAFALRSRLTPAYAGLYTLKHTPAYAGLRRLFWPGRSRLFWPKPAYTGQKPAFSGQSRLFSGQKAGFSGQSRLLPGQKEPAYAGFTSRLFPLGATERSRLTPAEAGSFWPGKEPAFGQKKPAYTEPASGRLWPEEPERWAPRPLKGRGCQYVTSRRDKRAARLLNDVILRRLEAPERAFAENTLMAPKGNWKPAKAGFFRVFREEAGLHREEAGSNR